jgi:hypothetical protein
LNQASTEPLHNEEDGFESSELQQDVNKGDLLGGQGANLDLGF